MTCKDYPFERYEHIFDGATSHPFNSFVGTDQFPEGHLCLCGEKAWHKKTVEDFWEERQRNWKPSIYEVHYLKQ